jgi:para-nitrobenzyl esterase
MRTNLMKLAVATALLVGSGAIAGQAPEAAGDPLVRVASGELRGQRLPQGGASFLGIPYAAAPIGALRWSDPAPVAKWSGVRDATKFAGACKQIAAGWNESLIATASEDCLYLNVWTPKLESSAKLPVMVWIHGGGFTGGSATDPTFSGERFASKGVILVSINYRLGIFGFLAHPELSKASRHASSGNYGLLDQNAALRWVHLNISKFGGDPSAVTVFGQSAGGGSVMYLLTSPRAHGLLNRAIVESGASVGGPGPSPKHTLAEAEATGKLIAGDSGIAALRQLSADALLQRWQEYSKANRGNNVGPVVDDYVVKEDPAQAFASHRELPVALMIGNNADEGFIPVRNADLPKALQQFYGEQAPEAIKLYAPTSDDAPTPMPPRGSPAALWMTDSSLRCGAVMIAARHAANGNPVYEYQFEQPMPGKEALGAAHSFELPYVFGNFAQSGPFGAAYSAKDRGLSDVMIGYWSNFAKHGDPNGTGLPHWPRFEPQSRAYIRFNTELNGDAVADRDLRRQACELFEARIEALRVHQ